MANAKLNFENDIEKLKQKITSYKETLISLKAGDIIDDYLLMKDEHSSLKSKAGNLEGRTEKMDEKQIMQHEDYEQKAEHFSVQLEQLSHAIGQLNEGLSSFTTNLNNKDNQIQQTERTELGITQDPSNFNTSEKNRTPIKLPKTPSFQSDTFFTSYNELREVVNSAKNVNEISASQSLDHNLDYKNEQQSLPNHRFPSASNLPHHTSNRSFRNFNAPTKKHIIQAAAPQNFSQNNHTQHADVKTNHTPKTTVETFNKVHAIVENEKKINTPNISDTTKKKDNDGLSFFKFFSKMNYFKTPKD
ncbi:hypothetical protein [Sporosarcina sp. HYO08]|uniref:hypothetical protein n=1 Tax=Sporosarcina sp. HYO08 TaxID=1759557 RepID=UPI00079C7E44|nr:hypothetical protein [Sporosarcina sp. HYO08]KXH78578.1 hypothetical protein AU377_12930 [Sporosarcina sp. HYO08]